MKKCPYCGAKYSDEATECPVDHAPMVADEETECPVDHAAMVADKVTECWLTMRRWWRTRKLNVRLNEKHEGTGSKDVQRPPLTRREVAMIIGLLSMGTWSSVLLYLSVAILSDFESSGGHAGITHWFAVPFVALAGLCVIFSLLGVINRSARKPLFWTVVPLHGALLVPFNFGMAKLPGDDGLGWFFFVGGGSCVALLLSFGVLIMVSATTPHKR